MTDTTLCRIVPGGALREWLSEGRKPDAAIAANLKEPGYGE